MLQKTFDAAVDLEVRALIERHAPPVAIEACAYCGGFGRVAIPVVGALLWPTRPCSVCGGRGSIVVEA